MIRNRLKKLITGISIPQEYICTCLEDFSAPLSVTLSYAGVKEHKDVTHTHLFLGYKPLVIGFIEEVAGQNLYDPSTICLSFHNETFVANSSWDDFILDERSVAKLKLRKLSEEWNLGSKRVLFYEGIKGVHHFLNFFNQFINRQREKFKRSVSGNVNLPGNLLDQVRIAYSVPRIISIISVGDGEMINLFPTDLHGPVGDDFYLSSLRMGGKANEQVEQFSRIVISEVDVSKYKEVYALGKNHTKNLSERASFNILTETSESFHISLPQGVLRYRELRRIKSFDCGIHRIHSFEVVNKHSFKNHSTLSHIHQYFAQWRFDNGVSTQMLLR